MNVVRKDASITNVDDAFPGTFQVVLSAPTKDRDGETLLADEWKTPLPDHITFDIDHEMSVKGTVGSGKPWIDTENVMGAGKGALIVDGRYSSLQHAQDTRTLVAEGHINRTSVAYMTEKTQKGGKSTQTRELLNGAFVAIPANREAVILSSKGMKAGRRNSAADLTHLNAIIEHAVALGGDYTGGDGDNNEDVAAAKSFHRQIAAKAVAGSYEQAQSAISDALSAAYPSSGDDNYVYAYPTATFPDKVVYRVSGNTQDVGQWQADYSRNSDGTVTLGEPSRVNLVEQIVPINGNQDGASKAAADTSVAAAKAAAAEVDAAAEVQTVEQDIVEARKRFYATLSKGTES